LAEGAVLDPERAATARDTLCAWDGYAATPLVPLPGLARTLGVAEVWCKDESERFGIGSFKAVGGAYAVLRTLQDEVERRTGRRPGLQELLARAVPAVAEVTTVTASAGNHGRSVAWGSERLGCRSVVFLPHDAAPARAEAIRSHDAEVIRFDGGYDAAVEHAGREAAARGWLVVSDTSYPGYEAVPRAVSEGYTLLAAELLSGLDAEGSEPPTHLFVQTGVGGLATGVCGHLWWTLGSARPRFVAVEPLSADCFGRSLRAGRQVSVQGPFDTRMGGLASGVPSLIAWTLLRGCLDGALALPDGLVDEGVRVLESGELGASIVTGPSGAAGVAALLGLSRLPGAAGLLDLAPDSRIIVFVTETRF
jgi:diaminopropionate ammonia-lyase